MFLKKEDLQSFDKIKRLNLINSITGIKPANLIGTKDKNGQSNLAIFSSLIHLGSNPALLGFIVRPINEVRRHTYENILETQSYTINHIGINYIEQAHYTSAKFSKGQSEFETCSFTEEYLAGQTAPFVQEAIVKIGMTYLESIPIEANQTILVIGKVQQIDFPESLMDDRGHLDLEAAEGVGISGLNSYYSFKKLQQFPYARVSELPDFGKG